MGKPLIKADSLTSNLGQKSYSPLPEAYKARRAKLIELEKEFKKLFKKRLNGTITKSELSRFGSLPREIKAVTITDPTVVFKKKPNGKWDYIKENRWKVKGEPLAPGLKPIESHHKGGLDKYYSKIKGWDDDDIELLHETLAKRGRYLGNHPENRLQLDSSLHQGRARQNVVWDESIHGRIDAKDLSPDEFDQYIDDLILENITDSDVLPKKSLIPDDVDFINATSEDIDRLGDMLESDYALADEFTNKPVNKNLLWEGKTKSSRVTNFIKNNKANEAFWPEDTLEALKNQDLDRIVEIEKQLPGLREAAMQDALKSGKTLQQWEAISKNINLKRVLTSTYRAVEPVAKPVLQFAKPVAKYGIPVAGTVLAASNQRTLAAEYDKNPTTINLARKKIADIQVGLEAADTFTLGATGAATWVPNLIGDAAEHTLKTIQNPQTKEESELEIKKQVDTNFSTL